MYSQVSDLITHNSPYVRAAVLRYIARIDSENSYILLTRHLQDPQPVVRMEAIDQLDECNFVDAVELIRPMVNDEDKDVRQAAQTALIHLES
jgi:HEAT repeat protein